MFPSFIDDLILASDLCDIPMTPEKEPKETSDLCDIPMTPEKDAEETKRVDSDSSVGLTSFFSKKKPRTRRPCVRKWSNKQNRKESWAENMKRRCTHCRAEKTPQWREGPSGPKTLCNACGVRYKSGRLVPEYRPVASPTFDNCKHSNSHKQILKRKLSGGV
ncbi:hypothetical protein SLA2020_280930 [Shorea laevis]